MIEFVDKNNNKPHIFMLVNCDKDTLPQYFIVVEHTYGILKLP